MAEGIISGCLYRRLIQRFNTPFCFSSPGSLEEDSLLTYYSLDSHVTSVFFLTWSSWSAFGIFFLDRYLFQDTSAVWCGISCVYLCPNKNILWLRVVFFIVISTGSDTGNSSLPNRNFFCWVLCFWIQVLCNWLISIIFLQFIFSPAKSNPCILPNNAGGIYVGKMCCMQYMGHIRMYMIEVSGLEYLSICWQNQGDFTHLRKGWIIHLEHILSCCNWNERKS